MVSHDLAAVTQATHRIVYLDGGIQYDGPTEELPDLSELANLRGIEHVHSVSVPSWDEIITEVE
jgi:ABC-type Mn2+/Zn2+ transport system ATPase subunit